MAMGAASGYLTRPQIRALKQRVGGGRERI